MIMDPGSLGVPGQNERPSYSPASVPDPVPDMHVPTVPLLENHGRNDRPTTHGGQHVERKRKPKRNEIRAFGKATHRGDRFVNRFRHHQYPAGTRYLTVESDVRGLPLFVLKDSHGKTTTMRSRTLMERYERVADERESDS